MSTSLIQVKDIIVSTVNNVIPLLRTLNKEGEFEYNNDKPLINKQVAEEIIKVFQKETTRGNDLKLYDVEQCLDCVKHDKSRIITECVNAIFTLYKTKDIEEVTTEVVFVLSKIQIEVERAQIKTMTTKEIRESFECGLFELLKQISYKKAFHFETMLRSKDLKSLRLSIQCDLARNDPLCFLAATSIIGIILVESNVSLNEMIHSFIRSNGLITRGVAVNILLNYLSNENVIEISSKIERKFIQEALLDEKILTCCCLMKDEQQIQIKHLGEYINKMFLNILQNKDDNLDISNTHIDTSIRVALFSSYFALHEEFDICFCLKENLEVFLNTRNDIKILSNNTFLTLFKEKNISIKDCLLESIINMFLTTIIYTNAALSCILDRDVVKKMTRNEIVKQICAYASSEKINYSKENSDFYNCILCALFIRDDKILKQKDPEDTLLTLVNKAQVFQLLAEPNKELYRDILLSVIKKFNDHIETIPNRVEGRVEVKENNSQLRLMLMMAVNREAENYIKQHQTKVVIEFLSKTNPTESLTKTEQALKRFLVPSFLSVLAIVLNDHFITISGYNDNKETQDHELRLKCYLERSFQIHNCVAFSEQNILNQIQELLININIYSKLRSYINKNTDLFFTTISAQLTKALKDKNLDSISKNCLERTIYVCRFKQDVKILLDKFLLYIFSDFVEKAHLKTRDFDEKATIIKLQSNLILNSEIMSILDSNAICDLKTVFKGRFHQDKYEFTRIKQSSKINKNPTHLQFLDFDSQKTNKVKIPNEPEQYIPILITAFTIRIWAANQGLTKLKEIKESKNIPKITDIICSITDKNEILHLVKDLSISPIDRELFELCFKLSSCNEKYRTSITEIEHSLLFTTLKLQEDKQLSRYIFNVYDDLINSAKKFNKTQIANKLKIDRQQQAVKDRQREKSKQKKLKSKHNITEKELHELEEHSSAQYFVTFEEQIQSESASNSSETASEDKKLTDTQLSVTSIESNDSQAEQTQNIIQTSKNSISAENAELANIQTTVDSETTRKQELLSKSVSEIEYEAQAAALDEMNNEFGPLTERERQMLAIFFSKIQNKACKPLYEKGQLETSIDTENETKESFEKHAVSDLAELEGAAANLQNYYEVIIPRSFTKWLNKLNPKTREDINKRLDQIVSLGAFGNSRSVHHKLAGAFELKFSNAYGTRVYYIVNNKTVYILCGGDKDDQDETITSRLKVLVKDVKLRYSF